MGGAEARAVDAAVHAERFDGIRILQRQRDFWTLREMAVHAQHAVRRAGGESALPGGERKGETGKYEVTVALRNSMMLMRISLRM